MSATNRLAKRTEAQKELEVRLNESRNLVLYAHAVLTWRRPIDFGVLIATVLLALWFYAKTETTLITILSLLVVTWVSISWVILNFNVAIPWETLTSLLPAEYKDTNAKHYQEAINFFVRSRYGVTDSIDDIKAFQQGSNGLFSAQVVAVGLLTAFLGSFMSGFKVTVIFVFTLLLTPGIIANSIPSKAYSVIEPYVQVYVAKALVLKDKLIAMVNEKLNGGKPATAAATPAVEQKDVDPNREKTE
eukprot:TRINITY_DN699_c0_g1_i1.p1 TRINITY_DN699_c0_g1~~TRINITY_DN699_c0_g1_i1.p1  ORF type:complete len:246 (+),score=96.74 TRINITY_DN699_c0_g1_i1:45-782(+)